MGYARVCVGLLAVLLTACSASVRQTPESTGKYALETVQRRDDQRFLNLCATKDDVLAALDASPEMPEDKKREWLKYLKETDWTALRESQLSNFHRVCDAANWKQAVVEEYEYKVETTSGPPRCADICVWTMIDARRVGLRLDDPFLSPTGWCTMEPRPVRACIGAEVVK